MKNTLKDAGLALLLILLAYACYYILGSMDEMLRGAVTESVE